MSEHINVIVTYTYVCATRTYYALYSFNNTNSYRN